MSRESAYSDAEFANFAGDDLCAKFVGINTEGTGMRILSSILLTAFATAANSQLAGIPASDSLGADDLYGNPSLIGGVANGGGTAHGVW